jgi:hypothetical protein
VLFCVAARRWLDRRQCADLRSNARTQHTRQQKRIRATKQTQGFYVFIRALQLLKANNDGVVLVRCCAGVCLL